MDLYQAAKADIQELSDHLTRLSQLILQKQNNFLPHAIVMSDEGKAELFGAAPDKDLTSAPEVLALLHAGLRRQTGRQSLRAIAIAEDVTVTLPGKQPTQAIKVLFEHKNGLTIALYQPVSRKADRP